MKHLLLSAFVLATATSWAAAEVRVPAPPTPAANNREVIELLKQVIKKLEAQNSQLSAEARARQMNEAAERVKQILKAQQARVALAQRAAALKAAQEELETARRRLREAEEKVHKLKGGAAGGHFIPGNARPSFSFQIKPNVGFKMFEFKAPPMAGTAACPKGECASPEKRLEALQRELESLRRDLKNRQR